MKALTFHGKQTIHYESVPDPILINPTDVIVKVNHCAICGSDLHPYHEREKGLDHGTVMGHEFIGEIVEIGSAIKQFKIGQLVMSPFSINCGHCFYCKKGLTSRCVQSHPYGWVENKLGLQGVQAEYARVPLADSTLMHLPSGVTPAEALLLGDILSTGYFCAEMAELKPDGVYAVIGCGPVGLMAIIAARELGAEKIYAIDSVTSRLAQAKKLGAMPINFLELDPVEVVKAATEGRGADSIMELAGNPAATTLAMNLLRPGGILSVAGMHTEESFAFSPSAAYNKNLTYKTGRCSARYYMEKLIPLVQSKKYDLSSIISHQLPLAEGVRAYEMFDKKLDNCTKVMLTP